METKTEDQEVYRIQTFGHAGAFNLRILLGIGRDLTDTDKSNIRDCAEKLSELIRIETIKTDPKHIAEGIEEKKSILALFDGHAIFVEEIPNEYDPRYYHNWFVVTTKLGRIKIGWRKRVINIDWSDSTIEHIAGVLFKDEDTTTGVKLIHAWGYEKAKEYIDKLLATESK